MTDVHLLAGVNRWVGVAIAVVGAVVVAPSGFQLLLAEARSWLRHRRRQIRKLLARILPFLRNQHANVHGITATASGRATVGAVATVSARVWRPTAPVDERIEALHQHITEVEAKLSETNNRLGAETASRAQAIADLQQALATDITELRGLLVERERDAARIDARGLPVIAAGIVLSGVPDDLASIPYGVGWLAPFIGLVLAVTAAVPAWRESRARNQDQ